MLLSYMWIGLGWMGMGSLCGVTIRASLRDANKYTSLLKYKTIQIKGYLVANLNGAFWAESNLTLAEVLLEVDDILGNHDGVLDVGLNPLQALDTLLACVPSDSYSNILSF